jgi:hypothetical protein
MSAFETISNWPTIGLSSEEWFSGLTADAPPDTTFQGESQPDDDQRAFRLVLERIKVLYEQLRDDRSMDTSAAAEESMVSQSVHECGEALRAIASKPSFREQLYLLRDDEATDILDAIQSVSPLLNTLH